LSKEDIYEGGRKLPLLEDFYTLQGEGKFTGTAAYFIRVGGCDIGCKWCDTKFSWNPDIHTLTDIDTIIEKAADFPAKTIVVTGGEPTTYDLNYLTSNLIAKGIKTHLETSGVYKLTGTWDWICLSPKKHNKPLNEFYNIANELKVIIETEEDLKWAVENEELVNNDCELFLQPEWSNFENIIHTVVSFIKENPKWKMSIQAHKYMHIP
jgi:organic radical activating enzyme